MTKPKVRWKTRAVERYITQGDEWTCPICEKQVKFQARINASKVVVNHYTKGVWDGLFVYHRDCYVDGGSPHGDLPEADVKSLRGKTVAEVG